MNNINSSKLCIIGRNGMGGYTCKWMDNRGDFAGNLVACKTLEAVERAAIERGFTQACDPTIPGRRGIRQLVAA